MTRPKLQCPWCHRKVAVRGAILISHRLMGTRCRGSGKYGDTLYRLT